MLSDVIYCLIRFTLQIFVFQLQTSLRHSLLTNTLRRSNDNAIDDKERLYFVILSEHSKFKNICEGCSALIRKLFAEITELPLIGNSCRIDLSTLINAADKDKSAEVG